MIRIRNPQHSRLWIAPLKRIHLHGRLRLIFRLCCLESLQIVLELIAKRMWIGNSA